MNWKNACGLGILFWQAKSPRLYISCLYFKINLTVASKIRRDNTVVQHPELCARLKPLKITIFSIYRGSKWNLGTIKILSVERWSLQKPSVWSPISICVEALPNSPVNLWVSSSLTDGVCIAIEGLILNKEDCRLVFHWFIELIGSNEH